MEIILDTNALIYAAKYKVDILREIRTKFGLTAVSVPTSVLDELKMLAKTAEKATDRDAAWLAYQIVREKKIIEKKMQGTVDDAILDYAVKNKAAVLTNDIRLKAKLKEAGIKVYLIRQKKLIEEA